jgi:Cytochrome c554 and c-prime
LRRTNESALLGSLALSLSLSVLVALAADKDGPAVTFANFRPRKEIIGAGYLGPLSCASCHSRRSSSQSHTVMADALSSPRESVVLRTHPRMTFRAGRFSFEIVTDGQQTEYRVTDGTETLCAEVLYAFGNARVAQTYVFGRAGKLYEGRVSYYKAIDGLDWTIGDRLNPPPSLEEAAGRDISGDEARNCFSCHATGAVVNNKLELDHLIPGVTCEACHGPGQKHAMAELLEMGADAPIFDPKTLDPETLSQEFCGACHRGVDAVAMMPDLGGIGNVRFQPYRLFNSRRHNPKDAHFACTACHDPHEDLKRGDALYDSKCTNCHPPSGEIQPAASVPQDRKRSMPSTDHKSCPVENERCVTCHMPKVELPGAHFHFTDHRIRIVRAGAPYPF